MRKSFGSHGRQRVTRSDCDGHGGGHGKKTVGLMSATVRRPPYTQSQLESLQKKEKNSMETAEKPQKTNENDSEKALTDLIEVLGRLFSLRLSQMPQDVAVTACELLASRKGSARFVIDLGTAITLRCSIVRGNATVDLFEAEQACMEFGYMPADGATN
ncbi:MAG: hypothetical protein ACM3JB_07225 [Acidobacteriaceae bacterium]